MNRDKLSYIFLIVIGVLTLFNILIYFTDIPKFVWEINNYITIFVSFYIAWKKRGIKEKDRSLTILGFVFSFLYLSTASLLLIKFNI